MKRIPCSPCCRLINITFLNESGTYDDGGARILFPIAAFYCMKHWRHNYAVCELPCDMLQVACEEVAG
jgi:hypothetical protein